MVLYCLSIVCPRSVRACDYIGSNGVFNIDDPANGAIRINIHWVKHDRMNARISWCNEIRDTMGVKYVGLSR